MTDVRCEACGYGVATRVPQVCPMCGSAAWTASTGRGASEQLAHDTPAIVVDPAGVRSLPRGAALLLRLGARIRGWASSARAVLPGTRSAGVVEVAIGRGRAPIRLDGPAGRRLDN